MPPSRQALGQMRTRLILEKLQENPDQNDAFAPTYCPFAEVFAHILWLNSAFTYMAERPQTRITHLIQIRWRADVTPSLQFRLHDRTFKIHSCADLNERHRLLICECEEIL